jgi:hypothetical protein
VAAAAAAAGTANSDYELHLCNLCLAFHTPLRPREHKYCPLTHRHVRANRRTRAPIQRSRLPTPDTLAQTIRLHLDSRSRHPRDPARVRVRALHLTMQCSRSALTQLAADYTSFSPSSPDIPSTFPDTSPAAHHQSHRICGTSSVGSRGIS